MVKQKFTERGEALFRIVVLIVSGIILAIWRYLVFVLMIINWILTLIENKRNKELAIFCEYWNTETYKFVRYMTFVSNKRPFPFTNMERISKFEKR